MAVIWRSFCSLSNFHVLVEANMASGWSGYCVNRSDTKQAAMLVAICVTKLPGFVHAPKELTIHRSERCCTLFSPGMVFLVSHFTAVSKAVCTTSISRFRTSVISAFPSVHLVKLTLGESMLYCTRMHCDRPYVVLRTLLTRTDTVLYIKWLTWHQ